MGFDEDSRGDSDLLARIKNALNAVFLALLIWIGKSVSELSTEAAVTKLMIANLQTQMTEAKAAMANRYTAADSEKDLRIRDAAISQMDHRLATLEAIARSNRDEIERLRALLGAEPVARRK